MFSLFSGIYSHYFSPTPLNILLLGPSNSGKTALLERVKVTEFAQEKTKIQERYYSNAARRINGVDTPQARSASSSTRQERTATMTMSTTAAAAAERQQGVPRMTSKRRLLACPTPFMGQKYMKDKEDDDEEEGDQQQKEDNDNNRTTSSNNNDDTANMPLNLAEESWSLPQQQQQLLLDARTSSLEDVLIDPKEEGEANQNGLPQQQSDNHNSATTAPTAATPRPTSTEENNRNNPEDQQQQQQQEFDLKKGAKMLPLDKIRPTIGCNLAKNVVIQNCVCKLFDVGGSMQDLWPQYYLDADCVVFVIPNNDNERSDVELLEDVRRQIPDDVPFLIFVHDMNNEASSSFHHNHQQLLPNYHSNLMQIHHGNAKTGQGVRDAFEWLIQCAKRQAQLKNTTTSTK